MSMFNSSCGKEKIEEIFKNGDVKLFFVGILGAGMAPLAELLHYLGFKIVGSDRVWNSTAGYLSRLGIKILPQNSLATLEGVSAVVYSLAIDERAREIVLARRRGIPLISRAELLGWIADKYKRRVGVAGSHGKSSTVAIAERIFSASEVEPTVVSGATLSVGESALRKGAEDLFLFEACEYKDSFLCTSPTVAVITGIELDHTDYFKDIEQLKKSFARFASSAERAVINLDCPTARKLAESLGEKALTYGIAEEADYKYEVHSMDADGISFSVRLRDGECLKFKTRAIGSFVVKNATAAVAVADVLGLPHSAIINAVNEYSGISRRLERLSTDCEREVFYDYAHHPTEIREAINSIKSIYGKCTVVFRPHTYSRTASLWNEFVSALGEAEHICLVDIYAARENALQGISSEELAKAIGEKAIYLRAEEVYPYVMKKTSGPVILMGAGEIEIIKKDFLNEKRK